MDVASFVFGAIPIAVQLFQSTVALYSYYSDTQDIGKTSATYQTFIRIEQTRYENWGEYARRDKGTLVTQLRTPTSADVNLILDILAHIAEALLKARKLEKKFHTENSSPPGPAPTITAAPGPTQSSPDSLAVGTLDLSSAIAIRQQRLIKLAQEVKSRLKFIASIKFVVWEKGKLEALITELRTFNDGLEKITGHYQKQLENKLLLQILDAQSAQNLVTLGSVTEIVYPTISEMAKRKATYLELRKRQLQQRNDGTLNLTDSDPELKLVYSDMILRQEKHPSGREFGTYQGTPVMIEWKILSKDMSEDQGLCRIRDLAKFLSRNNPSKDESLTHLPGSLGYFRNPGQTGRVALVYEVSNTKHQTLTELLKDTKNEHFNLGARFRLALSLAESVFFLHITGWLHKGIHSGNIIVSGDTMKNHAGTRALQPYLVGFNAARLNDGAEISEKIEVDARTDLYQHPEYQASNKDETGYIRQYDIYSLGLVLLELGMWELIESSGDYKPKKYNATKFLGKLLNRGPVDSLSFTMGNAYKRAVVWCLRGQFEKTDGESEFKSLKEAEKSMVFWNNVVLELVRCSVEE